MKSTTLPLSKITYKTVEDGKPLSRDIVVIEGYAFYRSTGENSRLGRILLPMVYVSKIDIRKPPSAEYTSNDRYKNALEGCFGSDLVTRFQNDERFYRFGNPMALCISYAVDQKNWDILIEKKNPLSERLAHIKDFLLGNSPYKEEIERIRRKNYVIQDKPAKVYSTKDREALNRQLRSMGQLYFSSETFPRVENCGLNFDREMKSSDQYYIDMFKEQLPKFIDGLLKKAQGRKITILSACKSAIDRANDMKKLKTLFELVIKTALQRIKNPNSLFSTSTLGEEAVTLLNSQDFDLLKVLYVSPDNVKYSDLVRFVTGTDDVSFFSARNHGANFKEIDKRLESEFGQKPASDVRIAR